MSRIVCITLFLLPLAAQTPTASVVGRVVDASGAPLSGAYVSAQGAMSDAARADLQTDAAALRIEALQASIGKQVIEALSAYRRAKAEAGTAEKTHRLAWVREESARRLFERGRGDSFAATDAEDELKQAQTVWLAAQADVVASAYRLLRVTGTLVECPPALKPKDANK